MMLLDVQLGSLMLVGIAGDARVSIHRSSRALLRLTGATNVSQVAVLPAARLSKVVNVSLVEN